MTLQRSPNDGSPERIATGRLSARIENGSVRDICWDDVEVVRGVFASVRDLNWGEIPEVRSQTNWKRSETAFEASWSIVLPDDQAVGTVKIEMQAAGNLKLSWMLKAQKELTINRAGWNVLHPLEGVAGEPLAIVEVGGKSKADQFPTLIKPDQIATEFVGLKHEVFGVSVDIRLTGEEFEMEDQRNWSDASFKTYCRPLKRPTPFRIPVGQTVTQSVEIDLSGTCEKPRRERVSHQKILMPEIQLALESDWRGDVPAGCSVLARFGEKPWPKDSLDILRTHQFDAEFIVPESADPLDHLANWAETLRQAGLRPNHVLALPEPFLKSYQPDGKWPDGSSPDECARAAKEAFPDASIGLGMLTNFTELNRFRPNAGLGDFITHGNSAIVHAADDQSVRETLEAMPWIFRSGAKIADDRDYRLGLCSIGMRTNPYGAALNPNPQNQKMTMTDQDPRQGTRFAAAYAVVLTARAAANGIQSVCLGAPSGPFAISGPMTEAIRLLAAMSGRMAGLSDIEGRISIESDGATIFANATNTVWSEPPGGDLLPMDFRINGAGS